MNTGDTISWSPSLIVYKWSEDQLRWVARKTGARDLQGWQLRQLLNSNAEEYVTDEGNLLTYVGLAFMLSVLTGVTTTTTSHPLNYTYLPVGVGDGGGSVPTAAVTDSDLTATSNRFYNPVDNGYPTVGAAGSTAGTWTVQSTFTSASANYAWNEWGLYGSTSQFTVGQSSQPTNSTMINHKGVSLGTKVLTNVWTLQASVTLS
jgi:hypothetical protein